MTDIKDFLKEQAFFNGLSLDMVKYIAGCGQNKHFGAGEYISKEGQPADEFYIVRSGKLAVQLHHPTKGELIIKTLNEGDIGGLSWIIPPYTMQFDLKALVSTSVVALDGKCMRGKCDEDNEMGYLLMKQAALEMNNRLMNTRIQLLDVYSSRV